MITRPFKRRQKNEARIISYYSLDIGGKCADVSLCQTGTSTSTGTSTGTGTGTQAGTGTSTSTSTSQTGTGTSTGTSQTRHTAQARDVHLGNP